MRKTVLGRHIYSVGGNSGAARAVRRQGPSGSTSWSSSTWACSPALAGMVFAARLNAANPKAGTGFELEAIAAVFIGGAAVAGGVGTVSGAIIGGLVLGVLNNGMANLSVGTDCSRSSRAWSCCRGGVRRAVQGPGPALVHRDDAVGAEPQGAATGGPRPGRARGRRGAPRYAGRGADQPEQLPGDLDKVGPSGASDPQA